MEAFFAAAVAAAARGGKLAEWPSSAATGAAAGR
jgi:hypothetical protein